MWADNESKVDLLRFGYLVSAVKRLVLDPALRPVTVGVYGDWGSGKSTVIQLVQEELKGSPKVKVLSFNGWLFEGYEGAKSALMGSILDELRADPGIMKKAGDCIKRLMKRIDVMQLAGMTVKYGLPAVLGLPHLALLGVGADVVKKLGDKAKDVDPEALSKLVKETPSAEEVRQSVREFRRDFEDLLEKAEIDVLVVFIDDLDRCLPDTVIATLEAIKLFLFVPRTAFVIGADERLIQYAVRKNFPELPGAETDVGRDYLEKLIQVPVYVPPLSATDIESYMNLLFTQKHSSSDQFQKACGAVRDFRSTDLTAGSFPASRCRELVQPLPDGMEEALDLTMQTAAVLAPGLNGSPRRTKRFLNTLLLRLEMAADRGLDVKRRGLAKLMLLEYIRPVFFRQLAQWTAAQGGTPKELSEAEPLARSTAEDAVERDHPAAESKEDGAKRIKVAPSSPKTPSDRVAPWLADPWMANWLASEPTMAGVDLSAYFFVAQARLGAMEQSAGRLSPVAREVLVQLLDPGKPTQQQGLKMASTLSDTDATALLSAIAERLRQAEDDEAKNLQSIVLDLAEKKPTLVPQVVAALQDLSSTRIAAGTPMKLVGVAKATNQVSIATPLLTEWSRGEGTLRTAATQALQKLQK